MSKMMSVITFFEIPTADFERAVKFYEAVFVTSLKREDMDCMRMAVFMDDNAKKGEGAGALVYAEHYTPSSDGSIVYFATDDLDALLERARQAGGNCVFGPHTLPENLGRIAQLIDCEGNRIGVHENTSLS